MPNQKKIVPKIDSSSLTTSCTTIGPVATEQNLHAKTSNYLKFIYSKGVGGWKKHVLVCVCLFV